MALTFRTRLVGTRFQSAEAKEAIKILSVEYSALSLEREPENPYDVNAIKVLTNDGELHLGYIQADLAEVIAPIMDSGIELICTVLDPAIPLLSVHK